MAVIQMIWCKTMKFSGTLAVLIMINILLVLSPILAASLSPNQSSPEMIFNNMKRTLDRIPLVSTINHAKASSNNRLIPLDTSRLPSFWGNMSRFNDLGLNITTISSTNVTYSKEDGSGEVIQLNKTELFFTSHINDDTPVRVFAAIIKPLDKLPPQSAIGAVIIHGLGGSHRSALPIAKRFASKGMVTVSIDLPGHGGQSSGTGTISADTLVQKDPQESLLYHDVIATYRAITLLLSLPEVNPNKVILTGGSFGGVMTFLTTALDDRIRVAIPLIATGDWETSTLAGSFLSALIPENESHASERVKAFIQNFDPLIYAAHVTVPVLMAIGTKDGFFVAETANETFSIIPSKNKSLLLLPNVQHEINEKFIITAEEWIQHYLNGTIQSQPPSLKVMFSKKPSIDGEKLDIQVIVNTIQPITRVELAIHEKIPGYSWFTKEMLQTGEGTFKDHWNAPIHGQKIQFFITVYLASGAAYSSLIWEVQLTSELTLPFWTIVASIIIIPAVAFLYHNFKRFYTLDLDDRRRYIQYQGSMHFFPFIFQLLLLISLFFIPWYTISIEGFSSLNWTIWQFLDFFLYVDWLPWAITFYAILTTTGMILEPRKTVMVTPIVPIGFFILGLMTVGFEGIGLGLYLALTAIILQVGIIGTLIYRTRQSSEMTNKSAANDEQGNELNSTKNDKGLRHENHELEQEKRLK